MGIVGPDGRELSGVRTEAPAGGARCLFCAVREPLPRSFSPQMPDGRALSVEEGYAFGLGLRDGVAEGLYAGLKVLAQILEGSGLEPDKAAEVVGAAASPCEACTRACAAAEVSGRARAAVEVAVGNVRAASVFVVGRGPGGMRVGP